MRRIEQVRITSTLSASCLSYRLSALCLLCVLATITIGCGAVSQGNNAASTQSGAQLAVFVPAVSGEVGVSYNVVPSVSGGAAPYLFSAEGTLPPGITVNSKTGSISGMPTAPGSYNFNLSVVDPPRTDRGLVPVRILVAAASSDGKNGIAITVSPASATVNSQAILQFSASVTGTSNTAVSWTTSAGTISSSGKFTAPQVSANTSVTITATSSGGTHSMATVNVTPAAALAITTSSLAEANAGVPYSTSLFATGGSLPYQWSLSSGTLPSGIQLQSSGVLAGSTGVSGSYPFTAKVTDSSGKNSTQALTLSISSLSTSGYDGPAELPRIYIQSAMANTPAPGATITVNSGGDFQSALNSASCGDTIALQAGATFSGVFTFPAKSCDDNHWIIVRTSAPDSALPAEGSRLTPCYAGVASLPGRPAFNCTSTSNVLAKLVMPTASLGPIIFASGANYYRLTGLEVTRLAGTGIVYSLASVKSGGTASNVILDRVWLHGTAKDETEKGLEFGGLSYASVVDSFFTDLHCISVSGSCTDASALSGGANSPVGPFKIVDNFLESSGENILFGGAESATTPADIEIRQNHLFKPLTWLKGQAGYVGGTNGNPFIVKNFFELKNAQRVLFEANIMENTWGGFSQNGYGIVLTPKNQAASGNSSNLCPNCLVTDVTVRYDTMSHVGGGLEIANGLSDNGGAAFEGQRYSIHDLTVDDINPVKYVGSGHFAEITSALGAPLLQNVSINHVTAFPPSGLFTIGGVAGGTKIPSFIFTNSLVMAGTYPIWSTGGTANCAYYDKPLTTFTACFNPYSFATNALIATPSGFPSTVWPAGNLFPASVAAVQFVNYNNGIGGNYQLLPSSPYKNAGSDGKDLGADIDTILSETAGVY